MQSGKVGDDFRSFCIDRAVWYFASTVEAEMDEAEAALNRSSKGKAKANELTAARRAVLERYIPPPPVDPNAPIPKGKYADPALFANVEKRRR